ncbi:MAG TPA: cyclic nucleotide-binding domain-containing protein [Candidatus Polarisedimenticolia bacterium]|nr:cyclic nucleotide-binding domain-containing protein [Candidatus Polarisedimenticolia bacterium]
MAGAPFKDLTIHRKRGEQVFVEGDLGSEMYIVQSGTVRIYREVDGVKQELAVMEKGDFFGEIAVLEGLPRSASAEALEDAELIEINSTTFDRMIRANIEIAVRMLRKLSNRLQEANHKIETLMRTSPDRTAVGAVTMVDIDRPSEAPPPAPDSAPSAGVHAAPQPLEAVEVPEGALGLLVLEGGSRLFPITSGAAVIGRYDPVTGTRPEIDLTQVDINRSVSRRHAKIVCQDGTFLLSEEVGALNGTHINSERLTPGQQSPLASGDKVAFGMVSLVFKAPS